MKKVIVTGQAGFVGTHLANTIKFCKCGEYEVIPFADAYFTDRQALKNVLCEADIIVHLAAQNRGEDRDVYQTNIDLIKILLATLDELERCPHILFSSSVQEENDSAYGRSKREGRLLFQEWAQKKQADFSGLIIPNVFGPYGKPFYNSVISTFCHLLVSDATPEIKIDKVLPLIYVNDLVDEIIAAFPQRGINSIVVAPRKKIAVSEILALLRSFKEEYQQNNRIIAGKDAFERDLFNTFRGFLPKSHYPQKLQVFTDNRGRLFEIVQSYSGGQVFYSETMPGITRGNHFHRRKVERFCVVNGEAKISLRKVNSSEVWDFFVNGNEPCTVDMPVYFTHSITNIGKIPLQTLFFTNEFFAKDDPDTYYEPV